MALQGLDEAGSFKEVPYDAEAPWSVGKCTDEDFFIDDLLGDTPDEILFHEGSLEAGELDLHSDEYGYYVINGSLHVDGILNLKVWDLYNPIVVMGDLSAKAIVLHAEAHLYVLGKTIISGPLVSDLGDGGGAYFKGGFSATSVFDLGHLEPNVGEGIPMVEVPSRYTDADAPVDAMLEDLRAGKPLS